ncbi:cellulose biosynthesis protein BcsP, partial [Bordetella pseudohinzii]
MRDISDISSLYREFGGDPRNYREIGQEGRAAAARGRWPLLGRIRPGVAAVPPAVGGPADRPARVA